MVGIQRTDGPALSLDNGHRGARHPHGAAENTADVEEADLDPADLGPADLEPAALAHELLNALSAALCAAQAAENVVRNPEHAHLLDECLERTTRNLRRCHSVAAATLRCTAGRSANRTIDDANGIARRAVDAAQQFANRRGARVELQLCERETPLHGDSDQLEIVASNLIRNAIEATPANGRVRVTTHANGHSFAIEVEDEGPGIRRSEWDWACAPARSKKRSTGLGLAIATRITRLHGGRLDLLDNGTGGACIRVVIPMWRETSDGRVRTA